MNFKSGWNNVAESLEFTDITIQRYPQNPVVMAIRDQQASAKGLHRKGHAAIEEVVELEAGRIVSLPRAEIGQQGPVVPTLVAVDYVGIRQAQASARQADQRVRRAIDERDVYGSTESGDQLTVQRQAGCEFRCLTAPGVDPRDAAETAFGNIQGAVAAPCLNS